MVLASRANNFYIQIVWLLWSKTSNVSAGFLKIMLFVKNEPIAINRRKFLQAAGLLCATELISPFSLARAAENISVLDLNPTKENPRNSEGAFVTLASGRILFCYTSFRGGADDASPADIVSIFSDDQGRTWSKDPKVVVKNPNGGNVMSVSLLRLQSGKIALFYLVKNSFLDCRPVVRISTDETATWSEPRHVGEAPGYFVLNNDRVIQLRNGRLIAPVAFHRSRAALPKIINPSTPARLRFGICRTTRAQPGSKRTIGLHCPHPRELDCRNRASLNWPTELC